MPSQDAYEKAVNLILADYAVERIGESKNPVFKLKDYNWLGKLLIMKTGEKEKLDLEAENAKRLEGILQEELGSVYSSPAPLAVVRNNLAPEAAPFIYLMEREDGKTLLEILQENKEEGMLYLDDAMKILALYHARTDPGGRFVTGRIDLESALLKRLEKVLPDSEYAGERKYIAKQFLPVIANLENALWVANKDAHPENFIITPEGRMVVIDTEPSYLVPQFIDLTNLLVYSGTLTLEEQAKLVEKYADYFRRFSGKTEDASANWRSYADSVIYRTYTNYGFFSDRPSKHGIALNWLRTAMEITDLMSSERTLSSSLRDAYRELNAITKKFYSRESGAKT
ncbi:hypothetical protein D6764_04160 [Candidatus Woesearchaeota archaeon]|nr:MAG: hypothetical protein D6764_04160 [Candidatus Woesearchaeota archaeon]